MKCALIFVSLLALGCALPLLQEASIHIAVATDGTISIYGNSGNKLVISRVWEHAGQKNVEVFAGVEHGTVKKIMVDHETTLKHVDALYQTGLTEADILVQIFEHHQGDVDVNTYTHLLEQVHSHAQSGHVRMALYNILKSFITQEVNWNENTAAHMVNSVSPKWFSLLNHLGLKTAGSRFTHETLSGISLSHAANIHIIVADDATVTIHGASGHKLVISKVWQNSGKNNVEVLAGVEHGTVERILQDQENTLELVNAQYQTGMTEADVLVQIFRNYQGEVDVNAYTHLLRAVFAHVQTGHVRMAVYNILKTFIANEVGLDTSMTNYVTPKWYSLYNILGSRQTGLESTQMTFNEAEEFPSIHEASFHVAIANDDTISIHGASGNKLVVSKVLKHLGNKNVVVYLGVEHGEMKEILLDQEFTMEHSYDDYHTDLTEADVLVQIFKHYQGDVDMYTYTNLLKQVYVHVQAGHIRMAVHNVLKNFFIHEINWARFVASGTHMGQHTAPEWQSLFNLKNTELEYGSDYSTELRNNLGYSEHMQKVTPENYYGWNLNAFTRPIYQRVQQTKWLPQQQNTHNNFMNTPFVY